MFLSLLPFRRALRFPDLKKRIANAGGTGRKIAGTILPLPFPNICFRTRKDLCGTRSTTNLFTRFPEPRTTKALGGNGQSLSARNWGTISSGTPSRMKRLLADCRAQLLALGVPISKSICPEVQMSRARHGFGWCRDNTSIDQYKYEYSLVLSRSVLSRPVPEIRRIICQELQKTIDNQG